jgi:hypothetical protein
MYSHLAADNRSDSLHASDAGTFVDCGNPGSTGSQLSSVGTFVSTDSPVSPEWPECSSYRGSSGLDHPTGMHVPAVDAARELNKVSRTPQVDLSPNQFIALQNQDENQASLVRTPFIPVFCSVMLTRGTENPHTT